MCEMGAIRGLAIGAAMGVNFAVDAGVFRAEIGLSGMCAGFGSGAGAAATIATSATNKICA